jgi:Histidine kinase-, DNA gyrase B-, and HSP90-like ATPase
MFKVQNVDFIADKLAAELLPDQEFREVVKNALEAVERRSLTEESPTGGRIVCDVDWTMLGETGHWYISCADNGDGMTRSELDKYTTTLAVIGADQNQSIRGNQGMGLKISGPTRHKRGVLIRSMKDGQRTAVQIGWDGTEYGLIPIGPNDEVVVSVPPAVFPKLISDQGSGTVVTFLGNNDDDNTFVPAGRAKGWLFKYLHTRFFRLDDKRVLVRVPTGDEDDWPKTLDEADRRMRNEGKSFNLSVVRGTGHVWDKAADKQGDGFRGVVTLPGDWNSGIPEADVHWWVLSSEGSDVSSRTHSGGSFAVLFQNELHDWKTGNLANPFFARLGVLFGKSRVAFVLEPKGTTVASDFARAHVLVNGTRVLDSDYWITWAEQFKRDMPPRIRQTMAEEQARLQAEDPDRVRRIRDRLQEVMQLLRPRRFKAATRGHVQAAGPTVSGAGDVDGASVVEVEAGSKPRTARRVRSRGIGAVLSELDNEDGTSSVEISVIQNLEPRWVSEEESDNFTIVKGNSHGMRDRAAALAGPDGRSANILLLNREFRGYQAIVAAINEWANPEGDDDKVAKIETLTQEWVEQKMIEAVEGLRQLENGKTWITEHYDEAMSPVALTAAFMADRYHTLREVKRAVGMFKPPAPPKRSLRTQTADQA